MTLAIIGAGAAGLMAAATILELDPSVEIFLLEKNNGIGKKVLISGGGRCNVTTGLRDVREVLKRYPRGGKFLSSAMYQFPPEEVYRWFEAHDVPLKTEEDLRVFPQSDNGRDVVGVFDRLFARGNVRLWLNASVTDVKKTEAGFSLTIKGREAEPLVVDRLIITTGGQAYRQTGSTGDGYAFAQALGHTITSLAPSLSAFFTKETWPHQLAGLSFERVKLTADRPSGATFEGPILFTHKGLTGPAVFALSSIVAFAPFDAAHPLHVTVDLFPARSIADFQGELHSKIKEFPRKSWVNVLSMSIPKSLAEMTCEQNEISPEKHAAEVSKLELARICGWLKAVPLTVIARGAGDEFVTAGGVTLEEVDPSTMESRRCPGLYFAGEVLDIDGFTGGFNLQASWATGRLAGREAVQER